MSTKLWYNEFVNDWMNALPLGNGRVGAMFYGDPDCERIEINEESLWSGKQIQEKYHASPEALAEIRKLIFEENSFPFGKDGRMVPIRFFGTLTKEDLIEFNKSKGKEKSTSFSL